MAKNLRRGLVLAGGGYVASAWEIGLVTGMAESGLDVRNADLFIGTSAGARVALELTSGRALEEVYQQRAGTEAPAPEAPARLDWAALRPQLEAARQAGGSTAEILQRYGALAQAVAQGTVAERRGVVAGQLPLADWPAQDLRIVAVSAATGARRAFDRDSGVPLVDAVIASTAAFGAPLLEFAGEPYFDGGYFSSDNADLAMGCERVLVLALRSPPQALRLVSIEDGVAALRAAGAQVEVIHPDADTMAALEATGGQMNPASGPAAAMAGRAQGQRVVGVGLREFLG